MEIRISFGNKHKYIIRLINPSINLLKAFQCPKTDLFQFEIGTKKIINK